MTNRETYVCRTKSFNKVAYYFSPGEKKKYLNKFIAFFQLPNYNT